MHDQPTDGCPCTDSLDQLRDSITALLLEMDEQRERNMERLARLNERKRALLQRDGA